MAGAIILLIIAGLLFWLSIWARAKQKREKIAKDLAKVEAQKVFDSLTPAEQAELSRKQVELQQKQEQEKKYFSGKYLTGHPDISGAVAVTNAQVKDDEIVIFSITPTQKPGTNTLSVIGRIPVPTVTNVAVEDASTVEKRITATRLLTVGIFAFAAKKKEVHSHYYLTITWGQAKIPNETIFEFEGQNAQTNANTLKNIIVKRVNALELIS